MTPTAARMITQVYMSYLFVLKKDIAIFCEGGGRRAGFQELAVTIA